MYAPKKAEETLPVSDEKNEKNGSQEDDAMGVDLDLTIDEEGAIGEAMDIDEEGVDVVKEDGEEEDEDPKATLSMCKYDVDVTANQDVRKLNEV